MKIAAFDFGGSFVKHALADELTLLHKGRFETPKTFEALLKSMQAVIASYGEQAEGVAISAPGAVNQTKKQIEGISFIPYLHGFAIFDAFETYFDLPVSIENDAYCAGLCEMTLGAGARLQHAAFVVFGTGVGGAIFINRKLHKGAHLLGGGFGFMKNQSSNVASEEATIVHATKRYTLVKEPIDGETLYAQAAAGDELSQTLIGEMYDHMSRLMHNIQVALDPEMIILGGGISERPEIVTEVSQRLRTSLQAYGLLHIMPDIEAAHYANDANLLGAVLHFKNEVAKK